jgi:hypothetical protein
MFKKNTNHLQKDLFSSDLMLPEKKLRKLQKSSEYTFYKLIFCNIDEERFSVLYSNKKSRPNAPVNAMISALILMQHKGWTYEHLFDQIDFDLKTRMALGLQTLADTPFAESTLFDFQTRINNYQIREGINLFESVFDSLTQGQLKQLKIKTDIQRSDSFLAASNIRRYSRVQLLVEVLIRFHRLLKDQDKEQYADLLKVYVEGTSHRFVYSLNRRDIPHKLEELGQVYHTLYHAFKSGYGDTEIFKILERVYQEHFTVVEERVAVKSSEDLHSSNLQSPDDMDATYRQKRAQYSRGQTVHVSETANPDNDINLITDVVVELNNIDDSVILNHRLEKMKSKTADLNELHTDGGYGSENNDIKMETLNINQIQTAVRGRTAAVSMKIKQQNHDCYQVICPFQQVISQPTRTRHKAVFDICVCKNCQMSSLCPTLLQTRNPGRVYYFKHSNYLSDKRRRRVAGIPIERQKLRPNVEATVKEFSIRKNHKGKLKVRGKFKAEMFAFTMAIGINFGRIYRNMVGKPSLLRELTQKFIPFMRRFRFCCLILKSTLNFVLYQNILIRSGRCE